MKLSPTIKENLLPGTIMLIAIILGCTFYIIGEINDTHRTQKRIQPIERLP